MPPPGRPSDLDAVLSLLEDEEVVPVVWALPGAACTELMGELWARAEVLRLLYGRGFEHTTPLCTLTGFALKVRFPNRGWLYIRTRKGRRHEPKAF